jgi:hypothetical protein
MTSTLLVPSCMTHQKFVVFGSRRNLQHEARLSLEQAPHHLNQGGGGTYNEKKHTVSRRLKRRKSTKLLFHERVEELRWISGTRAIRQAHIQKFLDDVIRHVTSYYSISSRSRSTIFGPSPRWSSSPPTGLPVTVWLCGFCMLTPQAGGVATKDEPSERFDQSGGPFKPRTLDLRWHQGALEEILLCVGKI